MDNNTITERNHLIKQANQIYNQNNKPIAWFGRCIFLSWYCSLGDCTFCFRTTQKHKIQHPKESRRSMSSLLMDALFCKVFNWRIEFLTGGYGIMPFSELLNIIKNVSVVYGEKIWLNLGVMAPSHIEQVKPYVKGIVSSLETMTPSIHEYACPSKPIEPYDKMFTTLDGFKKSIGCSKDVYDMFKDELVSLKKEHFFVLLLDTKNRIIKKELVSVGTLNSSIVHPREVFRSAIRESANSIILIHNHPSGDCEPSDEDVSITERLVEIGCLLDVSVLDHVVVGLDGYWSWKES